MRLRDGRTLAWTEWGSGALPVLFCTGAAMSGSLGFGTGFLDEFHARLIAVDRPGLGRSDPDPGKSFETWTEDVRQLGVEGCAAVGFSQGAPFALALAAAGIASAVAVVAGQDELGHPAMRPLLHPDVARMVDAVQRDRSAFEREFAATATAEGLRRLIVAMSSEHDRRVYADPPFAKQLALCLEEGFAQGAAGYARDLALALAPWPFELERIRAPIDLWYGALDTSPVHSPDFGATLARRLPAARRLFRQNEGGSILWTCAREIVAGVVGYLK